MRKYRHILSLRVPPLVLAVIAALFLWGAKDALSPVSLRYFAAETAASLSSAKTELISVAVNDMGNVSQELTLPVPVGAVLAAKGIELGPHDLITLSPELPLSEGNYILILRPTRVVLTDGGNTRELYTFAKSVEELLRGQSITLEELDILLPTPETLIREDLAIEITRIVKQEITRTKEIPFERKEEKSPDLRFGVERIVQKGVRGEKRERALATKKNGKIVKEEILETTITRDPIPQIVEAGTKIEIGRTEDGLASWYAFRGCMCAASHDYSRGTYVRVTRLDTGKTIIVRINDWGPDPRVHPERIIDLDSVAFKQLSGLSKGVVPVRVEEIL